MRKTQSKSGKLQTLFASPERADLQHLAQQAESLADVKHLYEIINALPSPTMILNEHRQMVLGNEAMLKQLSGATWLPFKGLRPGEMLKCIHADEGPNGCGTSEACRNCGAVRSILNSQFKATKSVQECRLTVMTDHGLESLDFEVTSAPLSVGDSPRFSLVSLQDISEKKRRAALEYVLFDHMLETAGEAQGLLGLAMQINGQEQKQLLSEAQSASQALVEEIEEKRILLAAERYDLTFQAQRINVLEFLQDLVQHVAEQDAAFGRRFDIDEHSVAIAIETDPLLLRLVLGNLIKNASEASEPGDVVTLSISQDNDRVLFSVNNHYVLPRVTQLQIFQRSFTTKGEGRGLGTYSAKLLAERYLKGSVSFESGVGKGTTFFVRLPIRPS